MDIDRLEMRSLEPEPKPEPESKSETKPGKEKLKAIEQIVFGFLQYIFLPVLCGFLTAGILAIAGLEKLGLDRFNFTNFTHIKFDGTTWSNYSGLKLSAGLGCILGMLLSRFMKFGARLGHFDFITPPLTLDTMEIPSARTFFMAIFRIVGIPVIVVLAAMSSLKLARMGILPGVVIDAKYQLFEVTLFGVVSVAGLGCLVMYVYDMMLSTLLRMTKRKEIELKELH